MLKGRQIVVFCAPSTESGCRATILDTIGRCQILGSDAPVRGGNARRRLEVLLPSSTPQARVADLIASLGWANLRAVPWLPHGSRPGPHNVQRMPSADAGLASVIRRAAPELCDFYAQGQACPYAGNCKYRCY